MISYHDETSPSIAAVSALSVACSIIHARGAATEKALSVIRGRVRSTTKLPHDEARSVDRPGILATDDRRSELKHFKQTINKTFAKQAVGLDVGAECRKSSRFTNNV